MSSRQALCAVVVLCVFFPLLNVQAQETSSSDPLGAKTPQPRQQASPETLLPALPQGLTATNAEECDLSGTWTIAYSGTVTCQGGGGPQSFSHEYEITTNGPNFTAISPDTRDPAGTQEHSLLGTVEGQEVSGGWRLSLTDLPNCGSSFIYRSGTFTGTLAGCDMMQLSLTGQWFCRNAQTCQVLPSTFSGTATATRHALPSLMAKFDFMPQTPQVNENISFNASDSIGDIETYTWVFGDGNSGQGKMATHAYMDSGSFTVTLTVTDRDGRTDAASQGIFVTCESNNRCIQVRFDPVLGCLMDDGVNQTKVRKVS